MVTDMWRFIVVAFILINYKLVRANSSEADVGTRVVNGTDAKDGEFPFIASLRKVVNVTGGSHSCGSSIISKRWLLTAAHCVAGRESSSINIQYGVTEITSTGPNVASVEEIIVHEGYNPSDNYINDIALLHLSAPLRLNDFINTVKLPKQGQVTRAGSDAVLVGWGLNASSGIVQTHLQKVDIKIFSDDDCQELHNNGTHFTNICAGVPGGGKGQCNGDSGGPLLVNGEQVGIVSWSVKPCTIAPYPGVFTKVAEYVNWIKSKAELSDDYGE